MKARSRRIVTPDSGRQVIPGGAGNLSTTQSKACTSEHTVMQLYQKVTGWMQSNFYYAGMGFWALKRVLFRILNIS